MQNQGHNLNKTITELDRGLILNKARGFLQKAQGRLGRVAGLVTWRPAAGRSTVAAWTGARHGWSTSPWWTGVA